MTDEQIAVLDEVVEGLRQVLAKCDEVGVATEAAIYVDLAMHLAMRERDPKFVVAA